MTVQQPANSVQTAPSSSQPAADGYANCACGARDRIGRVMKCPACVERDAAPSERDEVYCASCESHPCRCGR